MKSLDYSRLLYLKGLIDRNQATDDERMEYMQILYRNGNISKEQFDAYVQNHNSEEIINGALTIGGVLLVTWLITKLLEKS